MKGAQPPCPPFPASFPFWFFGCQKGSEGQGRKPEVVRTGRAPLPRVASRPPRGLGLLPWCPQELCEALGGPASC